MKLKVLSMEDCEQVRLWRNKCLNALRTPYPLTKEQQEEFYLNVVCSRTANDLYRGVTTEIGSGDDTIDMLIGMVGLENIERQNRRAEISIMISPEYRAAGFGEQALVELLKWGFNTENLENIYGDCYHCNMAVDFWDRMVTKHDGFSTTMKNTKYFHGEYWNSTWFNFNKEEWICRK